MSPTRRDLLASIGAAGLALALPTASIAAPAPVVQPDPIHALGHTAFEVFRGGQGTADSEIEFYADANRAIAWITNPDGTPQRLIFREPQAVAAVTLLMRRILGQECSFPAVICPDCDGAGWHANSDGGQKDCQSCDGRGYAI